MLEKAYSVYDELLGAGTPIRQRMYIPNNYHNTVIRRCQQETCVYILNMRNPLLA